MIPILSVVDICKSFPGVQALSHVSIDFEPAKVHAFVGMNGSGKSTLMKIVTGAIRQDSGEIWLNGHLVEINNVHSARALGIGMIFQELSLVPSLTVAENISVGHLPKRRLKSFVKWSETKERARSLLDKLNLKVNLDAYVEDLSVAQQQMVEIAKALSIDARILLMDEPSAVLTQKELANLFSLIGTLKSQGVTIIYISHRLEEVFQIADDVVVLRDGQLIGKRNTIELDESELVRMVVGKKITDLFPPHLKKEKGEKVFEIKGLNNTKLKDISFEVCNNEILGIFGLIGSGQNELVRSILGLEKDELKIKEYRVDSRPMKITSPHQAISAGIGYISADRKRDGLLLGLPVRENITITFLERFTRFAGLVNRKTEKASARELAKRLQIKTSSINTLVTNLSGGNQQKVILAKWLGKGSKILICHEPTRGIDIDAKSQVYRLLEELRQARVGIVIISSELSEVMGMCDRVMVITKGQMHGPVNTSQVTEEQVLAMAAGLETNSTGNRGEASQDF
jgi:ABC-type sugar transport system ATPase subunit